MKFYYKVGKTWKRVDGIKTVEMISEETQTEIPKLPDLEFSGTVTLSDESLQALIKAGVFSPLYRITLKENMYA